jgi:hypothetical protein
LKRCLIFDVLSRIETTPEFDALSKYILLYQKSTDSPAQRNQSLSFQKLVLLQTPVTGHARHMIES